MPDLRSTRLIVLKGILFLGIVAGSALVIFLGQPTWRVAALLVVLVWASARFYYFLFYVLERYVDPSLKYAGVLALLKGIVRRRRAPAFHGSPSHRDKEVRMTPVQGNPGEIHELARYEVRPEALDRCLAAIHEFVAYVRANEPGALRYEVWQETERPTRFVHIFVWRDEEANRVHGESDAVKNFAGILYPCCLQPVEFVAYKQVDANAAFRIA